MRANSKLRGCSTHPSITIDPREHKQELRQFAQLPQRLNVSDPTQYVAWSTDYVCRAWLLSIYRRDQQYPTVF